MTSILRLTFTNIHVSDSLKFIPFYSIFTFHQFINELFFIYNFSSIRLSALLLPRSGECLYICACILRCLLIWPNYIVWTKLCLIFELVFFNEKIKIIRTNYYQSKVTDNRHLVTLTQQPIKYYEDYWLWIKFIFSRISIQNHRKITLILKISSIFWHVHEFYRELN